MISKEELQQHYRRWEDIDRIGIYENTINRCKNLLYLKLCLFAFITPLSWYDPAFRYGYNGFSLNKYKMYNDIYG